MTTRAKHPPLSPSRVSSAQPPESGRRCSVWGTMWEAGPIQNRLKIVIEAGCQSRQNIAENVANPSKSASPGCLFHVQKCGMGAVRDGAQVVRA